MSRFIDRAISRWAGVNPRSVNVFDAVLKSPMCSMSG